MGDDLPVDTPEALETQGIPEIPETPGIPGTPDTLKTPARPPVTNWVAACFGQSWGRFDSLSNNLELIEQQIAGVGQAVADSRDDVDRRLGLIVQSQKVLTVLVTSLASSIDQILQMLAPPPPVAFVIDLISTTSLAPLTERQKKEKFTTMPALKATLDFQLLDNGTAQALLKPVDAAGMLATLPTGTPAPTWTASDPGITVTPGPDGLSAVVAPANPPVLVTGVTITATTTLPPVAPATVGVTLTGTSTPIDVTAGGPVGFQISLQ